MFNNQPTMNKKLKIVVLAKQVPDTRNVGKDAMTPEGTVNRAALPAIFNPEDLNALEMALSLKDRAEGSTVHVLTMGPQRAADIVRDAMFRGADGGYLLSGREFAGSDTLATSYALSCALRKIEPDVIFAGRRKSRRVRSCAGRTTGRRRWPAYPNRRTRGPKADNRRRLRGTSRRGRCRRHAAAPWSGHAPSNPPHGLSAKGPSPAR